MASKQCASTPLFICSLLLLAAFSNACGSCKPNPAPKTPPVNPAPKTPPVNPTPSTTSCPRDTLKLGVCAKLLGLVDLNLGSPPSGDECCPLLQGLADLEVAACLCTALKANVLGINLNVPIALSALVSACGKTIPKAFQCA